MTSHPIFTRNDGWPALWHAAQRIYWDADLSLLSIEHDGSIGWDELQDIKNQICGSESVAIEIYPPADRVVNNASMRHLWLLGPDDWWPDLGHEGQPAKTTLRERYLAAQIGGA